MRRTNNEEEEQWGRGGDVQGGKDEKGEGGELVKEIYEKVKNSLAVTDKEKLTSVFKSPNVPEDLRGGLYEVYDSLSEESQKDALWGKILKWEYLSLKRTKRRT